MCKGAYGKTLTGLDWSDKTWTGVVKTCRDKARKFFTIPTRTILCLSRLYFVQISFEIP